MRKASTWVFAGLLLAGSAGFVTFEASAQPVNLNTQRDCQTIRTCNFRRGGVYRGCLSSYSCRVCKFVSASCFVDGSRRVCQQMRCTWG